MAISSPGIGSNLDVNGIVSKLMSVEQAPLTALASKEAKFQAQLSGLGSLKGAISALQTAASALVPDTGSTPLKKFSVYSAAIADPAIASVTASSTAVPGQYSLEVTQLAQQHRIVTSTTATPFSGGGGTLVSGGTLTITLGTKGGASPNKTTGIAIADGSTPELIRDAINAANAGVSATVVNGTLGKQLVLVGDISGADQNIKLSGISALNYDPNATPIPASDAFTEAQTAQGSAFKINGIAVTASGNSVTTAIDGITLNLTQKSETDKPTTITISRDTSNLSAGINAFVSAYNALNQTASSLGSYNVSTKAAGILNGDSTLRSAQRILRSLIGNVPSAVSGSSLQRLSDIGISLQKDGTLAVNSSKLSAAISNNLNGVANLVSAYGTTFKTASDGLIGTTGTIGARTDGINASITSIGKQRVEVNLHLTQIEARYRKQFTALDVLMSNMTSTSNYLTTQLANLSSLTLSKN